MADGYDVTEDYLHPFDAAADGHATDDDDGDDHTIGWYPYDAAVDINIPNGDRFRSDSGPSYLFDHTDRGGLPEMFFYNDSAALCAGAPGVVGFRSDLSSAVTADPSVAGLATSSSVAVLMTAAASSASMCAARRLLLMAPLPPSLNPGRHPRSSRL